MIRNQNTNTSTTNTLSLPTTSSTTTAPTQRVHSPTTPLYSELSGYSLQSEAHIPHKEHILELPSEESEDASRREESTNEGNIQRGKAMRSFTDADPLETQLDRRRAEQHTLGFNGSSSSGNEEVHDHMEGEQETENGQPDLASALTDNNEYSHTHNLYEPVVNGEEDEEKALEEEASAAVYAKEVLGAPGDDEFMSLSGSEVHQGVPMNPFPSTAPEGVGASTDVPMRSAIHAESEEILPPPAKRLRLSENLQVNTITGNMLSSDEKSEGSREMDMSSSGYSGVQALGTSTVGTSAFNKKVHNEQWNEMLERLRAYKARHGDCLVPKRYQQDPKLGTWVETQRVQYKRLPRVYSDELGYEVPQPNKRLTQERLNKLQELGFSWSAKHVRKNSSKAKKEVKSAERTEETFAVNASYSDFSVTKNSGAGDVNDQASIQKLDTNGLHFDSTPGSVLTPMKLEDQSSFGFDENMVKGAKVFQATSDAENSSGSNQFSRISQKSQSKKRAESSSQVSSSANKWNSDAVWDEMYTRLLGFKEREGHCLVPRKFEADPKLASWVETQRVLWNRDYNQNNSKGRLASVSQGMATTPAAALEEAGPETKPILPSVGILKQLSAERKEKLDAIGFVWSLRSKRIEDHWDQMFHQLVEYKNLHGDCLVPSRYEANLKLGKWVETQRYEFTKLKRVSTQESNDQAAPSQSTTASSGRSANPRLTPERLRRLESIGFEWKVKNKMKRYYDKQWDAMFQRLLEFQKQYGHVNVPKRFPDDVKLGTWVHTQRIQYRKLMMGNTKGKKDEESLPQLGDTNTDDACMVETRAESPNSGCDAQSSIDQAQSFRLTEERRQRLESIGFCWSAREVERGCGAISPNDAGGNSNQGGTVVPGRMTRNSYDDQWDVMFTLLEKYKAEHGSCLVPKRYSANPKLGTWVDTQRVQYKKLQKKIAELQSQSERMDQRGQDEGTSMENKIKAAVVGRLTQERIERLQNLGFVWSLRDDWSKHYEELKAYRATHGHCNVPARYANNRRLGIWVSAQRQQYKIIQLQKNHPGEATYLGQTEADGLDARAPDKARRSAPLTQERIDLLNAIGFTWTIRSRDSLGESWNQRLQELRHFKSQYGHCLVPSRYERNPELGIWVGTQRTQYRLYMRARESGLAVATSMNDSRIRELEEMGFVWALRGGSVQDDVVLGSGPAEGMEMHAEVDPGTGIPTDSLMGQTLGNSGGLSPSMNEESGASICNELIATI